MSSWLRSLRALAALTLIWCTAPPVPILGIAPALAQNTTCATRPPGDSSNACASTAFVHQNSPPSATITSCTGVDDTAKFTAAFAASNVVNVAPGLTCGLGGFSLASNQSLDCNHSILTAVSGTQFIVQLGGPINGSAYISLKHCLPNDPHNYNMVSTTTNGAVNGGNEISVASVTGFNVGEPLDIQLRSGAFLQTKITSIDVPGNNLFLAQNVFASTYAVAVTSAGTGCTVGTALVAQGGGGPPATFKVATVSGSTVTGLTIEAPGMYNTQPGTSGVGVSLSDPTGVCTGVVATLSLAGALSGAKVEASWGSVVVKNTSYFTIDDVDCLTTFACAGFYTNNTTTNVSGDGYVNNLQCNACQDFGQFIDVSINVTYFLAETFYGAAHGSSAFGVVGTYRDDDAPPYAFAPSGGNHLVASNLGFESGTIVRGSNSGLTNDFFDSGYTNDTIAYYGLVCDGCNSLTITALSWNAFTGINSLSGTGGYGIGFYAGESRPAGQVNPTAARGNTIVGSIGGNNAADYYAADWYGDGSGYGAQISLAANLQTNWNGTSLVAQTVSGQTQAFTFNTGGGGGGGSPGGSTGQIQYNNAGSFGGFTLAGDCTFSVPNITCTKTSGTSFGALATLTPGTGVATALGNNVNASGGFPTVPVANAQLANSTISGISLGSNLSTLTFGTHLTSGGSSYNGSAGVTITSDATNANTNSTIVARDSSGNFSAGTITASLTGHASLDLALAGGTLTGKLITIATATGGAGLNLPHGTAPTSPVNGDLWTTTGGLYARINGTTIGPYGTGGGTGCTVTGTQYQPLVVNAAGTGCDADSLAILQSASLALGGGGTAGALGLDTDLTGGSVTLTAVTGSGISTGKQINVPVVNDTMTVNGTAQTFSAVKTFSSAPVFNALPTGTAVASAATASTLASRDANGGLTSVYMNSGYTTTATAAGTTTLTVASNQYQFFTGSTTQTVVLPVTSTLVLGQTYYVYNSSTGAVTVQSSGANNILVMAGGTTASFTVILTSGTTAASWAASYSGVSVASGKIATFSNSITFAGTDATTMTFPSTSATLAGLAIAETWTAAQTFTDGDFLLKGSSSGSMTLKAPAAASTYVMTFPAATDTVAVLGTAQTFTAVQTWAGALVVPLRKITAAGAVTVSATTDYYVCVDKTSGAATTVNLPASPSTGLTYLIKDCKGDAATNNITITPNAGNIDGSATYVINTNYQSVAVTYEGAQWSVN